jgi:hypothetical protein
MPAALRASWRDPGPILPLKASVPETRYPACEATGRTMEKTFLITFRPPELGTRVIMADHAEVHGEHLVFVTASGDLVMLFLVDLVHSWNEVLGRG